MMSHEMQVLLAMYSLGAIMGVIAGWYLTWRWYSKCIIVPRKTKIPTAQELVKEIMEYPLKDIEYWDSNIPPEKMKKPSLKDFNLPE